MHENHLNSSDLEIHDIGSILFQATSDGIIVLDENERIKNVNPKIEEMLGYMNGELIGESINVLHNRPKKKLDSDYQKKDNIDFGVQIECVRKDGSIFDIEVSKSYFQENGESMTMWLIKDLTERKKVEEDIMESLQKEKHLNELKSRFLSLTSHEFRTPLTSILSSAFLLAKYIGTENNDDKQHRHVNLIKMSVHHLTKILNDFLSLERLEEGKVELNDSKINIPVFFKEIIVDCKDLTKKGQKISYKHIGLDEMLLDQKMLKYIFNNLISNALKYSPDYGLVEFSTELNDNTFTAIVKDNGIGIPFEEQNQLFDRFFRAKNALNIQGTGLGLNIVKKYVEMSNGEINFRSEENKGTTFIITFPVQYTIND